MNEIEGDEPCEHGVWLGEPGKECFDCKVKPFKERIAALEAKAIENEKVFLMASANFGDERMKLESIIRDFCSFMDERGLWGDQHFTKRLLEKVKASSVWPIIKNGV